MLARPRINPVTTPTVQPILAPPIKAKLNTTYRDKICPGLRIVVALYADVFPFGQLFHISLRRNFFVASKPGGVATGDIILFCAPVRITGKRSKMLKHQHLPAFFRVAAGDMAASDFSRYGHRVFRILRQIMKAICRGELRIKNLLCMRKPRRAAFLSLLPLRTAPSCCWKLSSHRYTAR